MKNIENFDLEEAIFTDVDSNFSDTFFFYIENHCENLDDIESLRKIFLSTLNGCFNRYAHDYKEDRGWN